MNNKRKNVNRNIILTLILFSIIALGGYYFFSGKKSEIQYKTVKVTKTDLRSVIEATGTLDAVETVDVGTQISGTVKNVFIDYNSVVRKGDLIAEIDSQTQEADVLQAQANLMSAKADLMNYQAVLENAQKNYKRTEMLAQKDLVATIDVDADKKALLTAEAQVAAVRARIQQYEASLAKSKIILGYTKIYSPVDGVVIAKNVDSGQTVAASYQTPSIAAIARDLNQMQVEVNVDEADIGGVKEGQKAQFTVDTHPTEVFEGKVTQIRLSPTTSSNVVTYTVIVKVQNRNGMLMPGMTANVSLIVQEAQGVLVVPNSAFRFKPVDPSAKVDMPMGPGRGAGGGGRRLNVASDTVPTVYLLEKKAPVRTEVKKGITDGQRTEVLSGLSEGDTVITGIVVSAEGK
ncbi:MAG: efflux RND transporter periplasmic adaptor subunit [Synergistaceae bacterium]|jgi:HlyD family secretion protein|nr:efflux RND transporter periplasmic adaptor subunit [Synergistaceae bacterium]